MKLRTHQKRQKTYNYSHTNTHSWEEGIESVFMICIFPLHQITYPIKLLVAPKWTLRTLSWSFIHAIYSMWQKNKTKGNLSDAYLPNRDPEASLPACDVSWLCRQMSSSQSSQCCTFAVLSFVLVMSPLEMVWRIILRCCLVFPSAEKLRWTLRRRSAHCMASFKPVC